MSKTTGKLLTVHQAAERLGTTVRSRAASSLERRITFVRVGRHVRIPEGAIDEMIASGTVEAIERSRWGAA